MRIETHPVLGPLAQEEAFDIVVDGHPISARESDTVASALLAHGIRAFRTPPKRREPRGVFCAIGRCTDCAMTIDGVPNVRSCVTSVRPGMVVSTQVGLGRWLHGTGDAGQCPDRAVEPGSR